MDPANALTMCMVLWTRRKPGIRGLGIGLILVIAGCGNSDQPGAGGQEVGPALPLTTPIGHVTAEPATPAFNPTIAPAPVPASAAPAVAPASASVPVPTTNAGGATTGLGANTPIHTADPCSGGGKPAPQCPPP